MQTAVILVLLKGNVQHSVPVYATAPESLIIKNLHGEGSISSVSISGQVKRSSAEEAARLRAEYGPDEFAKAFPGANPKLPETFAEIGLVVEEPETKPAKKAAAAE